MLFFSLMMLFSKYAFVCFCICLLIFCVLFLLVLLLFLDLCLFVVFLSTNYSYCSYLYLFHGGQPVYPLCLSPLALILVLASYSSVCPRESGLGVNRSITYVLSATSSIDHHGYSLSPPVGFEPLTLSFSVMYIL